MSIGEQWVANPIFPWIVIILTLWIVLSSVVQARNWFRLRKLEENIKSASKQNVRPKIRNSTEIKEVEKNGGVISFPGSQNSTGTEPGSNEAN